MSSQGIPIYEPEDLRILEADAIRLGSQVLQMVVLSTRLALDDEEGLTRKISLWGGEVVEISRILIGKVISILARENRSSEDVLFLTSTIFLTSELEKISDEATKLANRVQKLQGEFPFQMKELLQEMSKLAQSNLNDSLRLYSQYSKEAALELIAKDDPVDVTFKTSRNLLLGMIRDDPSKGRQFLRCLEIFHALEHVSDRSVDIARRLRNCHEPFVKVSP